MIMLPFSLFISLPSSVRTLISGFIGARRRTKCCASIGSPPSQPRKPKSQYAEIVVPLERFLRLYAGFRSSVRNLG